MWYVHWIAFGQDYLACFRADGKAAWRCFISYTVEEPAYKAWLEWRGRK